MYVCLWLIDVKLFKYTPLKVLTRKICDRRLKTFIKNEIISRNETKCNKDEFHYLILISIIHNMYKNFVSSTSDNKYTHIYTFFTISISIN